MKTFLISKKLFLFFLFIFIGVMVTVYFSTDRKATDNLLVATLERQQRITEYSAFNIESFLNLSQRSIELLGQNYHVHTGTPPLKQVLDNFVRELEDTPIVGIVVTDKNGIVLFHSSRGGASGVGVDLSDREFFPWVKTAKIGEVLITKPVISRFGDSQGKAIISFASPVFHEGQFSGALVASLVLEDFINDYFKSVFPEKLDSYLIGTDGTVYVSPEVSQVGKNILEFSESGFGLEHELFRDELKRIVEASVSGSKDTVLSRGSSGKVERSLIAYAPITLFNDQTLLLVTVTSSQDALTYTAPIYLRQISLLAGMFFLLLFSAIFALKVIEVK